MGKGPLETFLKSRHCEWPTGTRKDFQHHQTSGVSCVRHLGSQAESLPTELPGKLSLVIREIQTKTTMRYHLTSVRIAFTKKKKKKNSWLGIGGK